MSIFKASKLFFIGLVLSAATAVNVANASNDRAFFNSVEGNWKGPGKIVAGKYKGTKFNCNFAGIPSAGKKLGITMDGTCRVGVFNQKMNATIQKSGNRYKGKFLDGAAGQGLDIVSGKFKKSKAVVGINRNKLDGAMVADFINPDTMNVTISVKVGSSMVPVIGMTLSRKLVRKTSLSD
ncbi:MULTISPECIES: hypothetical protein [unclassified Lentilitoribacter]|jgi:hypothetical protein|uniref:hypothetical protein n=1 Tax=unclassified Lentilitoribacter TaxID=2647570 RepID=UPI0013A6C448|nr:hypothetical protein [Lentilitoribacter sp. Alg239-R112]